MLARERARLGKGTPSVPVLGLREFIRDAWHVVEPATVYVHGWHVDAIAEHLEAVTRGDLRQLIINIPPRHAKSLLVAVFWPTWAWTREPSSRWLYASYAESLSVRDSLKCRRVIQSPWYQGRWGSLYSLVGDQNVKGRFENTATGYRIASSVGGSITGEGGDVVVADDPHNVKEGESALVREGVLRWWDEVMSTRLNDPRTGRRVVVMQRVHSEDLTGHLLEQGTWHHLCLPAEYEARVYHEGANLSQTTAPQPHDDCPLYADPRTQPGDLLWPERFGPDEINALKVSLGPYGAAGQLQQRPTPREGAIINVEHIKPLPPTLDMPLPGHSDLTLRKTLRRVVYIDLAWSEKETADYTAAVHLGADLSDNTYILDVLNERIDETDLAERIAPWLVALKPDVVGVEEGAFQQAATQQFIRRLYRQFRERKWGCGVVSVRPSRDKVMRAQLPAGRARAGLVYADRAAHWWYAFAQQVTAFPLGSHDDMVDAWSGAEQLAIEKVDWTDRESKPASYTIGAGGEDTPAWDPFAEYNAEFAAQMKGRRLERA